MTLEGKTFGNWQLGELLGEGSVGQVYAARHTRLPRTGAVKVVSRLLSQRPDVVRRFDREAQSTAELHHPNVVGVQDYSFQDEYLYIVLEMVTGGSLADLQGRVARGEEQLSLTASVDLVRQAALGLSAAHNHPRVLIHRDIKPGNILLEPREAPDLRAQYISKIADFGLVISVEGDNVATQTGNTVMGTPAYLSPEQCRGAPVVPQSDLYSLGVVLFELCTGQRPFAITSLLSAVQMHVYEPPPKPRSIAPNLPQKLEDLIVSCLHKDPTQRPASAAALVQALESWLVRGNPGPILRAVPALAPPPKPASPQRSVVVILKQPDIKVAPGQPTPLTLTLANFGTLTDHFKLFVDGIPEEWIHTSQDTYALNPGDQSNIPVVVRVPRSPETLAQQYDVKLSLRPIHPREGHTPTKAELALTVLPFQEFSSEIRPARVHGKTEGTFEVHVYNKGNAVQAFTLSGDDVDGAMEFDGTMPPLQVPPGGHAVRQVSVKLPNLGMRRRKTHPLTIQVASTDGTAITLDAVFVQSMLIRRRYPVLGLVFFTVLLGLVVFTVLVYALLFTMSW